MPKAHHFFHGRFIQWLGWGGKTKPNENNELCGTCTLRMECKCFRTGLPVDDCDDYKGDPSTRICKICHKLTILNAEKGYRCEHCGTIQIIPLAAWQVKDIAERIKEAVKKS